MSDDDAISLGAGSQRIRNVLTLEERVEVIRQYDIMPTYSKLAKNFNCSWEQIKSIVANREPIMEFYEATRHNNKKPPNSKFEELRRRKINFLGHCLYEYIQRAQFYLHVDINEELIRTKALDFQTLMGFENFVPNKSWINHFKAAYNITLSNRQIVMTRKPPRSLDLRDIMSYCCKNMPSNFGKLPDLPAPAHVTANSTQPAAMPLQGSVPATTGLEAVQLPRKRDSCGTAKDIRSLYRTKTLVEASTQNQATLDELQLRRKRKINFLEKALFEYISRSQLHHKNKGRLDVDHLREVAINLRDILKIDNFFPDRTWFNHFKSHYNFSFSQGVHYGMMLRRVPLSLDLRDIVSYCSRHDQRDQSMGNITLTPKEPESARLVQLPLADPKPAVSSNESNIAVENDDDCIAIDEPPELIEIKDDDEEPDRTELKRHAAQDSIPSLPLKIQKIESLNPGAHSTGHFSEDGADAESLPRRVTNYKDALRLLKPLEEFALLEENYRAIGLLTQLEKIFEGAVQQVQNDK
ncbi:PREDICTED: uncharacterized protein LOC108614707 [Drosophila arizonae]|uniref:Uncharacterized protein LOC108614707 n=1 Tax=Drosophila arizonae TaxID=7263 RepID=A0ABM1PB46_DROAR|nr:PREDICTED: uncharacterized protein LOC108614707 [Drosophila arizonae]